MMLPNLAILSGLDDRQVLLAAEVAARLRCSSQHVANLIDCGELAALDVRTGGRSSYRIPVEAYRSFVVKRLTSEIEDAVRDLPLNSLVALQRDLTAHLHRRGASVA